MNLEYVWAFNLQLFPVFVPLSHPVYLFHHQAAQIQSMIKAYIIDLQRDSEHVRAIQDYITHEATLLSFHKGDVIKVNPRQQMLESGRCDNATTCFYTVWWGCARLVLWGKITLFVL